MFEAKRNLTGYLRKNYEDQENRFQQILRNFFFKLQSNWGDMSLSTISTKNNCHLKTGNLSATSLKQRIRRLTTDVRTLKDEITHSQKKGGHVLAPSPPPKYTKLVD